MNKKEYYDQCEKCGRPFPKCPGSDGCQCSVKFHEYGKRAAGCIRNMDPKCPYNAVIPSVTVQNIDGIQRLRDCFVHVTSINTTFYIDDKGRLMITWSGPVELEEPYDVAANPLNLRSQLLYAIVGGVKAIYYFDKSGVGHKMFEEI